MGVLELMATVSILGSTVLLAVALCVPILWAEIRWVRFDPAARVHGALEAFPWLNVALVGPVLGVFGALWGGLLGGAAFAMVLAVLGLFGGAGTSALVTAYVFGRIAAHGIRCPLRGHLVAVHDLA